MTRPIDAPKFPPNSAFAQADASVALANETAFDALMAWMAEYIPTWGTSVALHMAVVLLAVFIAWENVPPPEFLPIPLIRPEPTPPRRLVGKRNDTNIMNLRPKTNNKMKPREGTFVFLPVEREIPGIADFDKRQTIVEIGIGGGPIGGSLEDIGGGSILFPPLREMGTQGAAKVVYLVDRSGSMTDSLEIVKYELKRSIGELREESEFHVIFYSAGPGVEMPTRRLVHATERNKQMAFEFIDLVIAMGGTDPSQAIERAFAVKPDLVYLLTDGEFDRAVADLVKRRNADGRVKVCTIGFLYHPKDPVLVDIAERNGGQYKFISEADLAAMIGG
jgi:hypothetical protein